MRRTFLVGLSLVLVCITASAHISPKISHNTLVPGVDYVPGEVLVKFMPELQEAGVDPSGELSEYKLGLLAEIPQIGWFRMAVPEDKPLGVVRTIEKLMDDPRIARATPNYILHLHNFATWTPNDWYYTQGHLWNLDIIGMPEAWALDTTPPMYGGDPDIIVGVIDTGVAYMDFEDTVSNPGTTVVHAQAPDFNQTNFVHGWNFINDTQYALDDNGHGTHVAGTVAQSTNNDPSGGAHETEYSAAGVAFNTTIMPLKTAARGGTSNSWDVADAITFAADNGAHVINMSLGSGGVGMYPPFDAQYDACEYAYDLGVVIVSSAGNDADGHGWSPEFNGVGYPAGFPTVIAVGASDSPLNPDDPNTEYRTAFSQFGVASEVLAPSGNWNSGDNNNSGKVDQIYQQDLRARMYPDLTNFIIRGSVGTSMSSPHVAGQAALILAYARQMGWDICNREVRARIAASAADLNHNEFPGYDYHHGFGRINVPASMTIDLKPTLVVREAHVFEGPGQGNGNSSHQGGKIQDSFSIT